jgi:leader peptidase (prepilin peptidase)/N-methyltransferase
MFVAACLRFGFSWSLPAFLFFFGGLISLAWIDLDHLILPKSIVYWCLALCSVALLVAAAAGDHWSRLLSSALCAVAAFAVFAAINRINPRWLGFGDVRLAPVLGLCLGWLGAGDALLGFILANLAGAVVGLGLIIAGRASRKVPLPFGVFLAIGSVVAVLAGSPIIQWYGTALGR